MKRRARVRAPKLFHRALRTCDSTCALTIGIIVSYNCQMENTTELLFDTCVHRWLGSVSYLRADLHEPLWPASDGHHLQDQQSVWQGIRLLAWTGKGRRIETRFWRVHHRDLAHLRTRSGSGSECGQRHGVC
jgi:hypothetical protein